MCDHREAVCRSATACCRVSKTGTHNYCVSCDIKRRFLWPHEALEAITVQLHIRYTIRTSSYHTSASALQYQRPDIYELFRRNSSRERIGRSTYVSRSLSPPTFTYTDTVRHRACKENQSPTCAQWRLQGYRPHLSALKCYHTAVLLPRHNTTTVVEVHTYCSPLLWRFY